MLNDIGDKIKTKNTTLSGYFQNIVQGKRRYRQIDTINKQIHKFDFHNFNIFSFRCVLGSKG